MYEYGHEQVKIRKKRWNNKEIRNLIENKYVNRKLKKKRGGGGVIPCHERLWFYIIEIEGMRLDVTERNILKKSYTMKEILLVENIDRK